MSVTRGIPITQADMDALADLANAKLGGFTGVPYTRISNQPYQFSYFDATVPPPTSVVGVGSSGGGHELGITCVRVYSYRTVGGRKHYSSKYATGWFNVTAPDVQIAWSWTPPAGGADGYIVLTSFQTLAGGADRVYTFVLPFQNWRDVSTASFSALSEADYIYTDFFITDPSNPNYNPVNAGPWRREMELIKRDIFTILQSGSLTVSPDWLVSGPWCVAVGHRLITNFPDGNYPELDAICHYKEVEFYFPTASHSGSVAVTREAFVKTESGSPGSTNTERHYAANLTTGGTVSAKFIAECAAAPGTWSHAITVISGAITIVSQTWTDRGQRIECDLSVTLPAGPSEFKIDISTSAGSNHYVCMWAGLALDTADFSPAAAPGLHPSSGTAKITYGGVSTSGPIEDFWGGSARLALRAQNIDGVWSAKTLPVFAEATFLEQDLPNYAPGARSWFASNNSGSAGSGPRSAVPEFILTESGQIAPQFDYNPDFVEPAVANRPSLWPVFRDTDFLLWKNINSGYDKRPVPFYHNGYSVNFSDVQTDAAGLFENDMFFPSNSTAARIYVESAAALRLYYKAAPTGNIDPDNAATYDGFVSGGLLKLPEDAAVPSGETLRIAVFNPDRVVTLFTERSLLFTNSVYYDAGLLPVFFARLTGYYDPHAGRAANELVSFNYSSGTREAGSFLEHSHEIPLAGYCITELLVRRAATGNPAAIPAAGTAALAVVIGRMSGTTIDEPGTFVAIQTATIPAGQPSTTVTVFWPVLAGTPIVYQCSEAVDIMAYVNHQPRVIANFDTDSLLGVGINFGSGTGYKASPKGKFSGPPYFRSDVLLRGSNYTFYEWPRSNNIGNYVTFPVCAPVYNDLEALLNLL